MRVPRPAIDRARRAARGEERLGRDRAQLDDPLRDARSEIWRLLSAAERADRRRRRSSLGVPVWRPRDRWVAGRRNEQTELTEFNTEARRNGDLFVCF